MLETLLFRKMNMRKLHTEAGGSEYEGSVRQRNGGPGAFALERLSATILLEGVSGMERPGEQVDTLSTHALDSTHPLQRKS